MGRGVLHARMRTSASRFSLVTCPFASSLCDASSPIEFGTPSCKQTLLLTEKRRQVTVDLRHHRYARAVPWMSNGHSMFFRPGHDLRPFFIPETLRRRTASLLFWVKFICPAGATSSRDMVVMCTGTSCALLFLRFAAATPLRTCSSPQLMCLLIQCLGSQGYVITLICVFEHRGLDNTGSF